MAHTLTTHLSQRNFYAALFTDDAAMLHALVLAAQAFVVLDRTENACAEQAVALRLERAVVDRLGLLDLAIRPRPDLLRAGDGDADRIEGLRPRTEAEQIEHVVVHGKVALP